jgi:hypothetical protein
VEAHWKPAFPSYPIAPAASRNVERPCSEHTVKPRALAMAIADDSRNPDHVICQAAGAGLICAPCAKVIHTVMYIACVAITSRLIEPPYNCWQ